MPLVTRRGHSSYSRNGSQLVNILRPNIGGADELEQKELEISNYSDATCDPMRSRANFAVRRLPMIRTGTVTAAAVG